MSKKWQRQMLFAGIGEAGQQRLLNARVAIVGCGATGSALASLLARAGVGEPPVLQVSLQKDRKRGAERFAIANVVCDQMPFSARDIYLSLFTLNISGLAEASYWLDSGSVVA